MLAGSASRFWTLAALSLLIVGCAAADEPRRSTATLAGDVPTFSTPRVTYEVIDDPDIGNVAFRGTVVGRSSTTVLAPSDGRVLEVYLSRGDQVSADDPVLEFLPAPSEAELIALDIAQLEVELALASAAAASQVASAEEARDALESSYDERSEIITAPTNGTVGATRQNVQYQVTKDQPLFTLSDAGDLIVEVAAKSEDLEDLSVGQSVLASTSAADATEPLLGNIVSVQPVAASAADSTLVVELEDTESVVLGDRVSVSIALGADADTTWVPLEFLHREGGRSFVLIEGEAAELRRADVRLGRRTVSHVQVLDGVQVGSTLVAPR